MKIIVADDEGIVLNSCRRILEAEGYEVLMAFTVEEALALLDTHSQTTELLMLIDVKMPVYDGMYLMKKAKGKRPDLPIIVMSGYATPETVKEAEDLGAARFIAKPFTPEELVDILHDLLRKEKSHE